MSDEGNVLRVIVSSDPPHSCTCPPHPLNKRELKQRRRQRRQRKRQKSSRSDEQNNNNNNLYCGLKMTTAQVVETSVTVNNNSPIQDYVHPDDQTQPTFEMTPEFKPFTVIHNSLYIFIINPNLLLITKPTIKSYL